MYNKFLKTGSAIIIIFLIIYLGTLIDWIFIPLLVFFQTVFFPIVIAGILFYIFRPIVHRLSKKIPRTLAILLLFFGFAALIVALLSLIVPEIENQMNSLVNSMPVIISEMQQLLIQIQQHELVQRFDLTEFFQVEEQVEQAGSIINNIMSNIVPNTLSFVGAVFNVLIALFVIPFILFYLLKEGEKFPNSILRFIQEKDNKKEASRILSGMDKMLSNYIQGILIVCSFIGILCYIAFTLIGLDYALILALFAMITNVIPYVGPWIGAVPAVIVGILQSPFMALLVIIIIVIIQQIESILLQPQVMGKKLSMHPVTVLILVLVAGQFLGIVGMLLAVPTYAVSKVFVTHLHRLWQVKQQENKLKDT
ncbi:AI-2E family transporter [Bacillus sp. FJAT-44742]|uniref:AI-2E family transporter n=1 Tax=Bacillus sp. FJAT-44742 TaxID=2014005 RepID=UPI000C248028|nr:AI-2E family transporter [Bacillus sp. FJAT-44742]